MTQAAASPQAIVSAEGMAPPEGRTSSPAGAPLSVAYRVAGKLGTEKADGLVITCSDRRYRRPVEHFVFKDLGLANYDILAIPGGVYMLSFAGVLPKQLKVGMQMIKFLVKNHAPPKIVLISHDGCSRYREGFASWLARAGFSLPDTQKEGLARTREQLREMFPGTDVQAYFASPEGEDAVRFEPV